MFNQNLMHPNLCTKGHQLKQTVITSCVEVNTLFRLAECIGQQNEEENVGATMYYLALLCSCLESSCKRSHRMYLMAYQGPNMVIKFNIHLTIWATINF